eukprot:scaffold40202_cov46-Attheya_sp.AAC.1
MGWQRFGGVGGVGGWVAWKWLGWGADIERWYPLAINHWLRLWCVLLFVGSGKRDVGARKSDSVATLEVEMGDGASSLFSASLSLFVVSG